MNNLTESEMIGLGIALAVAVATVLILIYSFRRPREHRVARSKPAPAPPPPPAPEPQPFTPNATDEPPRPTMLAAFEERSEISSGGGFSLVTMVLIDLVGLFVIFGNRAYVEASVFGQLANIVDRTNGLLILVLINQVLMCGVLLGRSRTFIMK